MTYSDADRSNTSAPAHFSRRPIAFSTSDITMSVWPAPAGISMFYETVATDASLTNKSTVSRVTMGVLYVWTPPQIDPERVVTLTGSDASGELSADDIQLTVTDNDGFTNLQEFEFGSDPNVADVDENSNGIPDAAETAKFNVAPILLLLLDDNEMPDPQTGDDTPVDNQE